MSGDHVEVDPDALRASADGIRSTGTGFRSLQRRLESVTGRWVTSSDPSRASFGMSIAPAVQQLDDALKGLERFCEGTADAVVVAADNYARTRDANADRVAGVAAEEAGIDPGETSGGGGVTTHASGRGEGEVIRGEVRGEDGVVRGESRGEDGSAWTYAYNADDRDNGGGFTLYGSRTVEVNPIRLAESKAGDDESPEHVRDQSGTRMAERVDRVLTPTDGRAGTEGVHVQQLDRTVGGPDGAEGVGYGLVQHAVHPRRAEPQSWSRGPDGKWHPLVRVEAQEVPADSGGGPPGTFELRTAESAARVMASGNGSAGTEGVHVQRQDRVVGEIHGVLPGPGVASSTAVAYGVAEGKVDGLARPDAEANAVAQARAAAEAQQAAEARATAEAQRVAEVQQATQEQRAAEAHAEQARSDAEANAAAQARAAAEAQRAAEARAADEAR